MSLAGASRMRISIKSAPRLRIPSSFPALVIFSSASKVSTAPNLVASGSTVPLVNSLSGSCKLSSLLEQAGGSYIKTSGFEYF